MNTIFPAGASTVLTPSFHTSSDTELFFNPRTQVAREASIIERIEAICAEFPCYGCRRVGAQLRHEGMIVNAKKVRRIMRERGLAAERKRRFAVTTDSEHDHPIFPNRTKNLDLTGLDELWVGDITYSAPRPGWSGVHVTGML